MKPLFLFPSLCDILLSYHVSVQRLVCGNHWETKCFQSKCVTENHHTVFFVLHFFLHLLLLLFIVFVGPAVLCCAVLCCAVCCTAVCVSLLLPLVGVAVDDDLCLFWSFIKQELELLIGCCNIILVVGDGMYVFCLTVCHSLSCSLWKLR